jgi:S-adenosylmethionine/arginine decarboxylase-like enzyme
MSVDTLSRHLMVELQGCPAELLANAETLAAALTGASGCAAGTPVFSHIREVGAGALAGVLMGEGAHVLIRTWPSMGAATADIVSVSPEPLASCLSSLLRTLQPSRHVTLEVGRGLPPQTVQIDGRSA